MADITSHDVEIALKELGDTSLDIYKTLQELKIRGSISNASRCPIARYLTSKFNKRFIVSQERIAWSISKDDWVTPSEVISQFILDFDDLRYPVIGTVFPELSPYPW